jgi:aryl-alcohol dehydrogenase-like predicted oxidoreductase
LSGEAKRAEEYPRGDTRHTDQRFKGKNYDVNIRAAEVVLDIAAEKGAKPAQIALAWLLHKGDDIVPIPGTKRRTYLEDNMAAIAIKLDPVQMKALNDAMEPSKIAGKRYNALVMATIDRKV